MAVEHAKRLLILGWDAADWRLADPLIAAGRMPNLARLMASGVRANLQTLEPRLSPLLWTTIATGKYADRHGILNFVEPRPDEAGLRVASSTSRRVKAIWSILSQVGRRVGVVNWYASHPAEPLPGACVSNLFCEAVTAGAVHPPELAERIAKRVVNADQIDRGTLRRFVPGIDSLRRDDSRLSVLSMELARAASVHGAALEVVASSSPLDCLMVFHDTIDTLGHRFMEFRAPRMAHCAKSDQRAFSRVMDELYVEHDRLLGELLAALDAQTRGEWSVMLLSDHGFHSDHHRPVIVDESKEDRAALEAKWHRTYGVLVCTGAPFKRGAVVGAPRVVDITPTALAVLGIPVGADMDGRVVAEAFEAVESAPLMAVPSWESEPGDAAQHPSERRLDPFEARQALKQLVDLGYMAALPADAQAQLEMVERESLFNRSVVRMTTARPAEAISDFELLVAQRPDEARFALSLAQCLLQTGRFGECASVLRAYLSRVGSSVEASLLLAGALARSGAMEESVRVGDEVARQHAARGDLAQALADLALMQGRWAQALAAARRAAEFDPWAAAPLVAQARALLALGEFERAAQQCLSAAERQRTLPEPHYLLGVALAWLGDRANARTSFGFALALEPGLIDAHRYLRELARADGDEAGAAEHAKREQELLSRGGLGGGSGGSGYAPDDPRSPQRWSGEVAGSN